MQVGNLLFELKKQEYLLSTVNETFLCKIKRWIKEMSNKV